MLLRKINAICFPDQLGLFFQPMLMSMLPEDLLTEILGEDVDTLKDEFMEDVLSMIPSGMPYRL